MQYKFMSPLQRIAIHKDNPTCTVCRQVLGTKRPFVIRSANGVVLVCETCRTAPDDSPRGKRRKALVNYG